MANKKMHHAVIGADTYEVIDQAARESIAENFDATTDYTAGEYVYNNAVLYRFTADHDAGAWTGTDAEEVKVGTEISTLFRLNFFIIIIINKPVSRQCLSQFIILRLNHLIS